MAFGNSIFNFNQAASIHHEFSMDMKTLMSCGVPPAIANKAAYSPKTLTTAELSQIRQCLEKTRHTIEQRVGDLDAIIQEFSCVESSNKI